jgi:hypothetical protein
MGMGARKERRRGSAGVAADYHISEYHGSLILSIANLVVLELQMDGKLETRKQKVASGEAKSTGHAPRSNAEIE